MLSSSTIGNPSHYYPSFSWSYSFFASFFISYYDYLYVDNYSSIFPYSLLSNYSLRFKPERLSYYYNDISSPLLLTWPTYLMMFYNDLNVSSIFWWWDRHWFSVLLPIKFDIFTNFPHFFFFLLLIWPMWVFKYRPYKMFSGTLHFFK